MTQPNNFFAVGAAGDTAVAAEDELEFALESVRICRSSMRAVSYREEDWWSTDEGHQYLVAQQELIARGGHIERIFILAGANSQENLRPFIEILDEQARFKLDVFYVFEGEIPAGYLAWAQDFILYDDSLLRISTSVPSDGTLGRRAEVHSEPDFVSLGLLWFNGLKAISTPHPGVIDAV